MTLEAAEFLISPDGVALLAEAGALPGDSVSKNLALRKRGHSLDVVSGALSLLEGRERARRRGFPEADRLFVTPDALAQATSPLLAGFHASLLAPLGRVVDVACGLGFDTLALARAGLDVLAIERDPVRLTLARANADVLGVRERITFSLGDATESYLSDWPAIFYDPARRTAPSAPNNGGASVRHSADSERYEPPLSLLDTWRTEGKAMVAKLSPALPDELLQSLGDSVLFLSESRECKEACVTFGLSDMRFGALLLPEGIFVPAQDDPEIAETLGAFLHDPDPALIRAGALGGVGAERISYDDAYLTSDVPAGSRLARSYQILETMTYQPKKLGAWLRARNIGRLVVKKRRFPKEPDAVARELGLSGAGDEATLVLVASGRGHLAVVCAPL